MWYNFFMDIENSPTATEPPPLSGETLARLGTFLIMLLLAIIGTDAVFAPQRIEFEGPGLTQPQATAPARPITAREIDRGDRSKEQVIFTFDGHLSSQSADTILEILAKHHVHASFFLTGHFVDTFPEVVRKIVAGGHEIFNHSMSHPYFTSLSDEDIIKQLSGMDEALIKVAGISTKPYFRPPYGDRDSRVLAAAYRAGYQSVYWTADTLDWQETEGRTAAQVKNSVLSNVAPGNIYLMHVGTAVTAAVLDELLSAVEERGFKIVPLTKGL